jgi:hypothetical protein
MVETSDQNDDRNVDINYCAHEVSDGKKNFIGDWTKSHAPYIMAKNLSTLCQSLRLCVGLNLKVME